MNETISHYSHTLLRGGYLFALLSAICYGSITTFATIAYQNGLSVEHLVISRGFIVAAICLGIAVFLRQSLGLRQMHLHRLIGLAITFVVTAFCQLGAVQYISVSLTVILFFTFPIFVTIYYTFTGIVIPSLWLFVPPAIALTGITIAMGSNLGGINLTGVALAMLAAMAMATSIIIAQKRLADSSVIGLSFACNLLASIMALILWGLSGQAHMPHFETGQATIGLTMMFAVGILFGAGIIFQFLGIRRIGSIPTSITLNFEPVVTLMVAAALISETLSWNTMVGAFLIVFSVLLSSNMTQSSSNTKIS